MLCDHPATFYTTKVNLAGIIQRAGKDGAPGNNNRQNNVTAMAFNFGFFRGTLIILSGVRNSGTSGSQNGITGKIFVPLRFLFSYRVGNRNLIAWT